MENITSINIDFENGLLEINGQSIRDKPIIAVLPADAGWTSQKLFNCELASGKQEEYDYLIVTYIKANAINDYSDRKSIWQYEGSDLTKEQIQEIEEYMERSMLFRDIIGGLIKVFVLVLIVLAIFFPDTLMSICRMI